MSVTRHRIGQAAAATVLALAVFQAEAQNITLDSTLRLPAQHGYKIEIGTPVGQILPEHYVVYTKITPQDTTQLILKMHSDGDTVLTPDEIKGAHYKYALRDGDSEKLRIEADSVFYTRLERPGAAPVRKDPPIYFFTNPGARRKICGDIEREFFDGLPVLPQPNKTQPPFKPPRP